MTFFIVYTVFSYYLIQRLLPHSVLNEEKLMTIPERLMVSVLWLPLLILAMVYSLLVYFYHIIIHEDHY